MTASLVILVFIFGTIIGSFLNVVIFRFGTGKGFGGRSICMHCAEKLSWYELVPIASYLIQGGRCSHCRGRISPLYPLVEILTGLVFIGVFYKLQYLLGLSTHYYIFATSFYLAIWSLLIIVAIYDLRHKIVPDKLVYAFIALAFFSAFLSSGLEPFFRMPSALDLWAGPILFAPFALIWLFSGGRLMGFGDAKLVLGIGFLLGLSKGVAAVLLSFWLGAVVSIIMVGVSRFPGFFKNGSEVTMKTEIPFAPFLIAGTLIAFVWNIDFGAIGSLFQAIQF